MAPKKASPKKASPKKAAGVKKTALKTPLSPRRLRSGATLQPALPNLTKKTKKKAAKKPVVHSARSSGASMKHTGSARSSGVAPGPPTPASPPFNPASLHIVHTLFTVKDLLTPLYQETDAELEGLIKVLEAVCKYIDPDRVAKW